MTSFRGVLPTIHVIFKIFLLNRDYLFIFRPYIYGPNEMEQEISYP